VTFKDLKKRVSTTHEIQQQTRLFGTIRDKSFWIWDVRQHKQVDIETNGDCCFNHIIGLPMKDGVEKPLFDLRTARTSAEGKVEKTAAAQYDLLDSLRLCTKHYRFE
jgi:hypothetical protein